MNRFIQELQAAAERDAVGPVSLVFFLVAVLLLLLLKTERRYILQSSGLFAGALCLLLLGAAIGATGLARSTNVLHWAGLMLGGIAMVNLLGLAVFDVLLAFVHVRLPAIARDVALAVGYIAVGMTLLSRAGLSLSGLVTTSAVLTAVIGLSMQDTLGNLFGGLIVQLDRSIKEGDWIKVDQNVGRVVEIRWRHTSIETRNWETVVIPNSVLMKSQVTVLGRRTGQPEQWRRWIYFNVDFRHAPSDVIATVESALRAEPIPNVAREPAPNCIAFDFKDSYALYAARYWLTDLAVDDPTDSVVRTRIFFALKRAGIPLSIPAASLFLTQETEARKDTKHEQDLAHRLAALAGVELFHSLNEAERRNLALHLRPTPFAKGEVITKQGAEAHWLYIITLGSAEIDVNFDGAPRRAVATLKAGDFFGEMSLMTGASRSASVIALEDVECYRLDKEAFMETLHQRPEIAEQISHVLARRQVELDAAREGLDAEARTARMKHVQSDFLARISAFFGLNPD